MAATPLPVVKITPRASGKVVDVASKYETFPWIDCAFTALPLYVMFDATTPFPISTLCTRLAGDCVFVTLICALEIDTKAIPTMVVISFLSVFLLIIKTSYLTSDCKYMVNVA
jgi:hypothetical protein